MTILELRRLTGLSQRQFADKYHIGLRSLQNWEQGVHKTPDYVLYLLSRVITEVDYIGQNGGESV